MFFPKITPKEFFPNLSEDELKIVEEVWDLQERLRQCSKWAWWEKMKLKSALKELQPVCMMIGFYQGIEDLKKYGVLKEL